MSILRHRDGRSSLRPSPAHAPLLAALVATLLAAAPATAGARFYVEQLFVAVDLNTSPWAVGNDAGPFVEAVGIGTAGAYFSAFVRKTTSPGKPGEVVLVATTGKRSIRVARKLA